MEEFKFDYTTKWYKHNPESVLENEISKILWDIEIQADHLISAKRPDLVIVKKKKTINKSKKKKQQKKQNKTRETAK